jgi:predicted dehydrogenase
MTAQTERDLRIGIVGFGARAGLWTLLHEPEQGSRVTVVCDPAEPRRAAAADAIQGVTTVATLEELIENGPDAVVVFTPDFTHAEVAVKTLEAGIATFVEKPLDITLEASDAILEAAYRSRTRLYIGHNMRHMPVIRQMRQIVEDDTIGQVQAIWCRHFVGHGGDYYFKDWHADRSKTTGLLLQKGAHDIDVIHWLAGGFTERVSAMGRLAVYGGIHDRRDNSDRQMADWFSLDNWPPREQTELHPIVDVEDISMMTMALDNGVLASYQQCHFTPDYWRNYTVIGDRGRLENMGDEAGDQIHVWTRRHRSGAGRPDEVHVIHGEEGTHGGADPRLLREFLTFVRDGGGTETSPIAARQAVAAGAMATVSLRGDGGALPVPPLDEDLVAYFEAGQPENF